MERNIELFTFAENCDEAKVRKVLEECNTGLHSEIRWISDVVCSNFIEAEVYIEKHDRGGYKYVAVRYHDAATLQSDDLASARKKKTELRSKYLAKSNELYSSTVASSFVGCKRCGSKLAAKYLTSNKCPVCRADLRSEKTMKQIEDMRKAAEAAEKNEREVITKVASNAPVKWLVKMSR